MGTRAKPRAASASRAGITLIPGAVRAAREQAGLSLAEVADGVVTRGAIHQVEVGLSRPSLRTLKHIARKTGQPLHFFTGPGAPVRARRQPHGLSRRIGEIEDLVAARDFQAARLRIGETLAQHPSRGLEGRLRYQLARCHSAIHDPELALETARKAHALAEVERDDLLAVRCLDLMGLSLCQLEQAADQQILRQALDAHRQLREPVPELLASILAHLGTSYVVRRQWSEAIEVHRSALEAAEGIRDLALIGTLYNDLSIAYQELGDPAAALKWAKKALAIAEMRRDPIAIARFHNNLGIILSRQGQASAAREHIQQAIQICETEGLSSGRANVLLTLARLEIEQENHEEAGRILVQATRLAQELGEPLTLSHAYQLGAELAEANADLGEAQRLHEGGIRVLQEGHASERLLDAYVALSDLHTRAGNMAAAAETLRAAVVIAAGAMRVGARQGRPAPPRAADRLRAEAV